jgi:hypothetical protein
MTEISMANITRYNPFEDFFNDFGKGFWVKPLALPAESDAPIAFEAAVQLASPARADSAPVVRRLYSTGRPIAGAAARSFARFIEDREAPWPDLDAASAASLEGAAGSTAVPLCGGGHVAVRLRTRGAGQSNEPSAPIYALLRVRGVVDGAVESAASIVSEVLGPVASASAPGPALGPGSEGCGWLR